MKYVWDNDRLRPWSEVVARRRERSRSLLPAPMIISDHLGDVKNPVDGRTYDSKSAYYQAVKAAGCEIVGNEAEKMVAPSIARSDVGRDEVGAALAKVKQGYKPAPLEHATKDELEVSGLDHD